MTFMTDVRDVAEDTKPLAAYEHNKAPSDAAAADRLALELGLQLSHHAGIGECSRKSQFSVVTAGLDKLRAYYELLKQRETTPRYVFQIRLGEMLGYDRADIKAWVRHSKESRECPCTLCGRDDLKADAHAARTQYHAV